MLVAILSLIFTNNQLECDYSKNGFALKRFDYQTIT